MLFGKEWAGALGSLALAIGFMFYTASGVEAVAPPVTSFSGSYVTTKFPNGLRGTCRVDLSPVVAIETSSEKKRFVAVHFGLDFEKFAACGPMMALESVSVNDSNPISMATGSLYEEVSATLGESPKAKYAVKITPRSGLTWAKVATVKQDLAIEITRVE